MKYTREQLNNIFKVISQMVGYIDYESIFIKNKEYSILSKAAFEEFGYWENIFEPLINYKVRFKIKGEHVHDGQIVEYTFIKRSVKPIHRFSVQSQ